MTDDTYLETDEPAEVSQATGDAAAALLEAFAETLRDAPDNRRFDVTVTVDEQAAENEPLTEWSE